MPDNLVSAQFTAEDQAAVSAAVATLKAKLPFLINLTKEERAALPKMGDKSLAFVRKALAVASKSNDFLPRSFDVQELRRDLELYEALYSLFVDLSQLYELVDDTTLAAGSDAYSGALVVYRYAKQSGDSEGLDLLVESMGKRFSRKPQPPTPTEPQS